MTDHNPTIFIVDNDEQNCRGLRRLLGEAGLHTRLFHSPDVFLASDAPDAHGCVLLDVSGPELDGLALQRALQARESPLPVVFLTDHGDVPTSVEAMKRGAIDFLTKPFDDAVLLQTVQQALAASRRQRRIHAERQRIKAHLATLTPRERQVFELVVTGMLNKQIGHELGTSEKTVKVHRGRVMRKLQAKSLADLVRMAERLGIGREWLDTR